MASGGGRAVDIVAANRANAAAEYAAKRAEARERAAALREQRARIAAEAQRLADLGMACSSDPPPADEPRHGKGPKAWWEKSEEAEAHTAAEERPRRQQRQYHFPDAPGHGEGREQQDRPSGHRRRRQWAKEPAEQYQWQPLEAEVPPAKAGEVLWQRPAPAPGPRAPDPPAAAPPANGESLDLDDATAAWLAMLRPDDQAPPVPAPRGAPSRKKKPWPRDEKENDKDGDEEVDEATKIWRGMLRSDSGSNARPRKPAPGPSAATPLPPPPVAHRRDLSEVLPPAFDANAPLPSSAALGDAAAWELSPPPRVPRRRSRESTLDPSELADALAEVQAPEPAPEEVQAPVRREGLRPRPLYRPEVANPLADEAAPAGAEEAALPHRRQSAPTSRNRDHLLAEMERAGVVYYAHGSDSRGSSRPASCRSGAGRPPLGRRSTASSDDGGQRTPEEATPPPRRSARPSASPPDRKPQWLGDLNEPARRVAPMRELEERPVGRHRPAVEDHGAVEHDDAAWHADVRARQPQVKTGVGRKPVFAPMTPLVAGGGGGSSSGGVKSPTSAKRALNKDKLAKLRRVSAGGVKKVLGKKPDDDPVTRQMVDKRQSRKDNGPSFKVALAAYRTGQSNVAVRLERGLSKKAAQGLMPRDDGLGVPVYLRKRPLFEHEVRKRDYDVISVDSDQRVVIHNCAMHADLKRMHILHRAYPCARAFDESATNDQVYDIAAYPQVETAAYGGQAAMFMYGQTGSGKTFTMSAIEQAGLHHLFALLAQQGGRSEVRIAIFEIAGKRCVDLLQGGRREVLLKETEGGSVELLGAAEPVVGSAAEALQLVAEAKTRRATASTAANATSSRSHCVTRVTAAGPAGQGTLTLVDCAGSERNADSMHHDAQARKECAEINASLYALRECIRLRRRQAEEAKAPGGGKHVHVPYRSSQLTRVLMECFTSPDAMVAVIATVSPSSQDTEHSMSTLQTVLMMAGASKDAVAEVKEDVQLAGSQTPHERLVKPVHWSAEEVREWLGKLKGGAFRRYLDGLPGDLNGRALVRMNKAALAQVCGGGNANAGLEMFNQLRNEIDRVDKVMRSQRKDVVNTNARLKAGW
eukprot:jgi/Tetstr1/427331/TSEL_017499.t2